MEDKRILSNEELDTALVSLAGWQRDGIVIRRDFVMANFADITSFLRHVVDTIATHNHHPDFSLDTATRTITVSVTTHSEGALTRADVDFATTLNAWQPDR